MGVWSEDEGRLASNSFKWVSVLAVVQKPVQLVASHVGCSTGLCHDRTPDFPRVSRPRVCVSVQDGSQRLLYSKLKVTFYHFCHIPWVWSKSQSPAHIQGGRRIEGHGYQEGSLGLALETAYHSTGILFSINPRQKLKKCSSSFYHVIVLSVSHYCSFNGICI